MFAKVMLAVSFLALGGCSLGPDALLGNKEPSGFQSSQPNSLPPSQSSGASSEASCDDSAVRIQERNDGSRSCNHPSKAEDFIASFSSSFGQTKLTLRRMGPTAMTVRLIVRGTGDGDLQELECKPVNRGQPAEFQAFDCNFKDGAPKHREYRFWKISVSDLQCPTIPVVCSVNAAKDSCSSINPNSIRPSLRERVMDSLNP